MLPGEAGVDCAEGGARVGLPDPNIFVDACVEPVVAEKRGV